MKRTYPWFVTKAVVWGLFLKKCLFIQLTEFSGTKTLVLVNFPKMCPVLIRTPARALFSPLKS